jgi:hypothetical protein
MSARDADQARAALEQLGAVWSPDLDAYASGRLPAHAVRCLLCKLAPCQCPPFGSAGYFALTDAVHGRGPRPLARSGACPAACGHGLEVHSEALGCWLCDCTHGRTAAAAAGLCESPACPMTPIVGAHTRGIATSGPAGTAGCIDDGRGPQIAQETPREDDAR